MGGDYFNVMPLIYALLAALAFGTLLGAGILRAGFRLYNVYTSRQREPRYVEQPGLFKSVGFVLVSTLLLGILRLSVDLGGLLFCVPVCIALLAGLLCWLDSLTWLQGLAISASYIAIALIVVLGLVPLLFRIILAFME